MITTNNDNPIRIVIIMIAFCMSALILFMCFSSCKSCNKPKPVDTTITNIEVAAKPVEDSLRKENHQLHDSLVKLQYQLMAANEKQQQTKQKATTTINHLHDALAKKDTVKIIEYAQQSDDDFRNYVQATEKEDSVQTEIITTQEKVITNLQADIELQKSKFSSAKDAYNRQSIALDLTKAELYKTQKKLKRAKKLNRVFGIGTGIGLAALVAKIFL